MNSQPSVFRASRPTAFPVLTPLFLAFICGATLLSAPLAHADDQREERSEVRSPASEGKETEGKETEGKETEAKNAETGNAEAKDVEARVSKDASKNSKRKKGKGKKGQNALWQWQAAPEARISDGLQLIHVGISSPDVINSDLLAAGVPSTKVFGALMTSSAKEAAADVLPAPAPQASEGQAQAKAATPKDPTGDQIAVASETTQGNNGVRIAQAAPNTPVAPPDRGAPAAAPKENPPALTVPLTPEKNPPPTPNTPNPDGTTSPATTPPITGSPSTPALEQQPLDEFAGREVADVNVVGNRVVPDTAILGLVATRRGAAFSPRQASLDRAKVTSLGFFASVAIQVAPSIDDPQNKINVTVAVVENRVITAIRVENNKQIPVADILKVIQSPIGSVLNSNTVSADVGRIQELYRSKGFAVLVTAARQQDDGTLVFTLQEGRVGRVLFQGNKKTSTALLRKLVRTRTGDAFDNATLRRDASALYDTNFFEDVSIAPPADDPENPGAVLITFIVKEKRTGQLQVGLGFDSRSKISGFLTLGENNFRGTGKNVSASVEAGSQQSFSVGFGDPFVGSRNAAYSVTAFSQRFIRQPNILETVAGVDVDSNSSFYEQRTGGRFNFTLPLDNSRFKNFLFGYRNERAKFYLNDTDGNRQDINDIIKNTGRPTGTVSAFSAGFLRDRRDSRLDASTGGREQIIIEQAIPLLGNVSFTKLDIDLRRYFPLMKVKGDNLSPTDRAKLVFALRGVAGISAGGSLPIFEQYFLGGPDTIRGYNVDEQLGNNQFYANFELRYRLQRALQIVAFSDVGRAFGGNVAGNIVNDGGVLFSAGLGIRLQTPIGPVRIDVGKPLGADNGRGRGFRTSFAIGPTF